MLGVAVGILLGWGVAAFREHLRRGRERRGHFEALAVEIQVCADMASGYMRGGVMAPAYRMPFIAYENSFPALLADGVLTFQETEALIRFYIGAQSFNFCLDQAQSVLMTKHEDRAAERLEREVRRARLKAQKLKREDGKKTHFDGAIEVVRAHLPAKSIARMSISPVELDEPAEVDNP